MHITDFMPNVVTQNDSHKQVYFYSHSEMWWNECGTNIVEKRGYIRRTNIEVESTHDEQQKFRLWYKYGNVDVQHRKIDQYTENEKKYFMIHSSKIEGKISK